MSQCIRILIKHSGASRPLNVDLAAPASVFKEDVYRLTGVPVERMKILVKGAILKDTANLFDAGMSNGQIVMVIGSAGPLPQIPINQGFPEDVEQLQPAFTNPPGLVNLGQTCYMNSSLQVLRAMPDLNRALEQHGPHGSSAESRFTMSLKNLFASMTGSAASLPPFVVMNTLRALVPQFAEQDRSGRYAQQDADEAWTQIISALRSSLRGSEGVSFVDRFMAAELSQTLRCTENLEEPETAHVENILKLECNISASTNHLLSGISENLDQQVEKFSPSLGRNAVYDQRSRLSRLPAYLPVHLVRFYWRRDIQKKAKIMRKVAFPLRLDMLELATDELAAKMRPAHNAAKRLLQLRDERLSSAAISPDPPSKSGTQPKMNQIERDAERDVSRAITEAGLDEKGLNPTGLYELYAMVTHKGASADSGHYIGWARMESEAAIDSQSEWYKFDVSIVNADKILSMSGGGEDSAAYILLYRAISVGTLTGAEVGTT